MTVARTLFWRKLRNLAQTMLLFTLMAGLLCAIGYMIIGLTGALWALCLAVFLIVISPGISPWMVLRMYHARVLELREAPGLYEVLAELSGRARLEPVPVIYYIPSRIMNAFSVGSRANSAIAVTDGLVRNLTWPELVGVLAHEMSHITKGDLRIMNLADSLSRFTSAFSNLGLIMLLFYLPVYMLSGIIIPLPAILLLFFAPTASILLQLALSRTREFEADLGAVSLTGDPRGLASALGKIDHRPLRIWDVILMPGRKVPAPSVLRTHPATDKRIARLLELAEKHEGRITAVRRGRALPGEIERVDRDPRWRIGGYWH